MVKGKKNLPSIFKKSKKVDLVSRQEQLVLVFSIWTETQENSPVSMEHQNYSDSKCTIWLKSSWTTTWTKQRPPHLFLHYTSHTHTNYRENMTRRSVPGLHYQQHNRSINQKSTPATWNTRTPPLCVCVCVCMHVCAYGVKNVCDSDVLQCRCTLLSILEIK